MSSRQHFGRRTPARARAVPRPTIHLLHWLLATLLAVALLAGLGAGAHASEAQATPAPVPATVAAPPPAAVAPPATLDVPGRGPDAPASFADLAARLLPAVVNISTTQTLKDPERGMEMPQFPPGSPFEDLFKDFLEKQGKNQDMAPRRATALGSGFIIDPSGLVVTNNHVITDADEISVILHDGRAFKAKVVGADSKADLALLRLEDAPSKLPSVPLGNSDLSRVGDWVLAIGNPYGLGGTVTAGIISARSRDINAGPYDDFIQTDAAINKGNSGGPLFNQAGQVIGIDSAIYTPNGGSVGIGFAIPSDIAGPVIAQLKDHGKVERGWLGIQMQPVNETMAKAVGLPRTEGVLVDQVLPESPAAQARLQQGDVITRFNGAAITTPRDLALAVAGTHAGQHAQVGIWRGGHDMTLDVAIGAQSKAEAAMDQGGHGSSVGMTLAPLNDQARTQYGLASSVRGVVVTDVTSGSRADESGIQPGDVLVRVGTTPVTSPRQVAEAIHAAERAKKEAVPLLVMRNGTTYYVALQLAAN